MNKENIFNNWISEFFFLLSLIFLLVNTEFCYADQNQDVLILNSYHKSFKWTDDQVSSIQKVIKNNLKSTEIYIEYMDTKRIYNPEYLAELRDMYRLKYKPTNLDTIITTDDNALRFALQHHEQIFGGAPISFCGINNYREHLITKHPKATGIVEVLDIKETLDLIFKVHPQTHTIVVVVDGTPTGKGQLKDVRSISPEYIEKGIQFEYIQGEKTTHQELFAKLQSLSPGSIVLLTVWLRDKNEVYLSPSKGGSLISQSSAVPVYGIIDLYFGEGIVGGKLLNSRVHGKIAAEKAVRIMEGTKPSQIPVTRSSVNPYMFDKEQMDRWNIHASQLPDESIIINDPVSFYQKYKILILITASIFIGLLAIVAVLTANIIRRRKAEYNLRKSEEKFRNIFDLSPQAIALSELQSGKLVDINEKLCELSQYSKDELLGRTTTELGLYADADRALFIAELTDKGQVNGLEMEFMAKDGSKLIALMFSRMIELGAESLILTIFFDLTHQKELEGRLQKAQRMEAIGNLASGIAHDFNNLLSPIIGMSELLLLDLPSNTQAYEDIKEILTAGNRGSELVKQLLAFGRQSEHTLMPVSLQQIAKEAYKLTRSFIPSEIEMIQDIQQDCRSVQADGPQIHQVVMNLITNAYHAVELNKGTITLRLKEIRFNHEEHAAFSLSPGCYARLTVEDTGHGIEPENQEKIFEPYFTTKEKGKGTGLGLATVYGIIKEHKGEIRVASESEKGTRFDLYLPVIEQSCDEISVQCFENDVTGSERILLVDDEEPIIRLEKQALERLGYEVTPCHDSLEALQIFKSHPQYFDLIVTDLSMPNLSGDKLALEILASRPEIPIILCTGFSDRINQETIQSIGIKGFLMKPIAQSEFAQLVRKLLDEACERHHHKLFR